MKRDVLANRYDGVVKAWKVRLIRSRARRFGIPRHDWPDIEQEIALEVMAFRFDAAKANGATETTALTSVIDNRMKMFLRRARALRNRVKDCHAADAEAALVCEDEGASAALDVQQALVALPVPERAVCFALSRGESLRKIAAAADCSRASVERAIRHIRRHFERMGLDGRAGV